MDKNIPQNSKSDIFKNKNCFITGATGGIGIKITEQMASRGCNLFLTSTDTEGLRKAKKALWGVKVMSEPGDLNRLEDVERIISKTKKEFGNIDILVNCAGVFPVKSLENSSREDFENCFYVNMRAPFLFSQAFLPEMKKKKWGRIVNIGSSSAYAGFPETSLYCASKHALLGFSRALYQELKEDGIRVFCISPGSVRTEMGKLVKNQDFDTFIDPKEIAEYVAFVISFDNEMVSEEIRLNRMQTQ